MLSQWLYINIKLYIYRAEQVQQNQEPRPMGKTVLDVETKLLISKR